MAKELKADKSKGEGIYAIKGNDGKVSARVLDYEKLSALRGTKAKIAPMTMKEAETYNSFQDKRTTDAKDYLEAIVSRIDMQSNANQKRKAHVEEWKKGHGMEETNVNQRTAENAAAEDTISLEEARNDTAELSMSDIMTKLYQGKILTSEEEKALNDAKDKEKDKKAMKGGRDGFGSSAKKEDLKPLKEDDIIHYMFNEWLLAGLNSAISYIDYGAQMLYYAIDRQREKAMFKDEKTGKETTACCPFYEPKEGLFHEGTGVFNSAKYRDFSKNTLDLTTKYTEGEISRIDGLMDIYSEDLAGLETLKNARGKLNPDGSPKDPAKPLTDEEKAKWEGVPKDKRKAYLEKDEDFNAFLEEGKKAAAARQALYTNTRKQLANLAAESVRMELLDEAMAQTQPKGAGMSPTGTAPAANNGEMQFPNISQQEFDKRVAERYGAMGLMVQMEMKDTKEFPPKKIMEKLEKQLGESKGHILDCVKEGRYSRNKPLDSFKSKAEGVAKDAKKLGGNIVGKDIGGR